MAPTSYTPSPALQAVGITTEKQLRQASHTSLKAKGITLELLTQDDQNAIALGRGSSNYADVLLPLRRDAYARAVQRLEIPSWLTGFAEVQAERFGPRCEVWGQQLPWIEAFLVARYGEECAYWPDGTAKTFQNGDPVPMALTALDETRADDWSDLIGSVVTP